MYDSMTNLDQKEKLNLQNSYALKTAVKDSLSCVNCLNCYSHSKSVFKEVRPEQINELSQSFKVIELKKGEALFREGEAPSQVYCVQSGNLKLTRNSDKADRREQVVRLVSGGHLLGHSAVHQSKQFNFSAIAVDEAKVCIIPLEIFKENMLKSPELANTFVDHLCEEVEHMETALAQLASGNVKERVAYTLWSLAQANGKANTTGTSITVKLSRAELASLSGTVTETFVRALTELKNENLIETRGKEIMVPNLKKLRASFSNAQ